MNGANLLQVVDNTYIINLDDKSQVRFIQVTERMYLN